MSVLQGSADLTKEDQTLSNGELVSFTVFIDGLAFHILHDKIGKTIVSGPAFKQPGNVCVFEVGKNLTLHHEAMQNCVGVHAPVDEFDGHLFAILIIGPHCEKNSPHPAMTNFAKDLIGANTLSDTIVTVTDFNIIESRNHAFIHDRWREKK